MQHESNSIRMELLTNEKDECDIVNKRKKKTQKISILYLSAWVAIQFIKVKLFLLFLTFIYIYIYTYERLRKNLLIVFFSSL